MITKAPTCQFCGAEGETQEIEVEFKEGGASTFRSCGHCAVKLFVRALQNHGFEATVEVIGATWLQ